jgi:tetratricopeptide (TPR) repeat protein
MGHTYNEHDLEQALRRTAPGGPPRPDFATWREKHPEALRVGAGGVGARADYDRSLISVLRIGRNIMKTRNRRFGLAAAAAVALAVALIVPGTNRAWSVEQTIAAMKKINTVHITGKNLCGGKMVDFECWVRTPAEGSNLLSLRYQCGCERRTTLVVQGNTVYQYRPAENIVRILDGSQIEDLQYWYEGAMISPWLTGKLLETLKLIGRNWEQTTVTDPNTGKEQIRVTCSHPKSNVSALLVVDPATKLVLKARLWSNLQREGQPEFDAQVIIYNPEIPDDLFEFEVPPGATVVTQEVEEQAMALFQQAVPLFHKEKKYAEAMELYRQIHDRFPHVSMAEESLMMVGICYGHLRQHDKAIETFLQAIKEYPQGWEGAIQFYLGAAYMRNGQTQEALKAFEACLADAEGKRGPDQFPVKEAREYIVKIKGQ